MGERGCPIERAVDILEGKWTLLILRELFQGTRRFGELRTTLEGVSPKTLTERLRFLEDRGVILRTIYPEIPPRVEYSLTERGRMAWPVIEALREWGEIVMQRPEQ
jgi:DNA-binding HxlR family transcriptional regulator